jgi:hypothetical protein
MLDLFPVEKKKNKSGTLPKLGFAFCLSNYQTEEAPHYWKDFSKVRCTGNGQAGMWTGTEEKTGSISLVI